MFNSTNVQLKNERIPHSVIEQNVQTEKMIVAICLNKLKKKQSSSVEIDGNLDSVCTDKTVNILYIFL